jgi:predicted SprT family Zn-dependent metalloprotease
MPRTSAVQRARMIGNTLARAQQREHLTDEEQNNLIRTNIRISNYGYGLHCPVCHTLGLPVQSIKRDGVIYRCNNCQEHVFATPDQIKGKVS